MKSYLRKLLFNQLLVFLIALIPVSLSFGQTKNPQQNHQKLSQSIVYKLTINEYLAVIENQNLDFLKDKEPTYNQKNFSVNTFKEEGVLLSGEKFQMMN